MTLVFAPVSWYARTYGIPRLEKLHTQGNDGGNRGVLNGSALYFCVFYTYSVI